MAENNKFEHIRDYIKSLTDTSSENIDMLLHDYQELFFPYKAELLFTRFLSLYDSYRAIHERQRGEKFEDRLLNHGPEQRDELYVLYCDEWREFVREKDNAKIITDIWTLFQDPEYTPPTFPQIINHTRAMCIFYKLVPEIEPIYLKTYTRFELSLLKLIEMANINLVWTYHAIPDAEREQKRIEEISQRKHMRKNQVIEKFIKWVNGDGKVLLRNGIPLYTAIGIFKKNMRIDQHPKTIISYLEESQELLQKEGINLPQ